MSSKNVMNVLLCVRTCFCLMGQFSPPTFQEKSLCVRGGLKKRGIGEWGTHPMPMQRSLRKVWNGCRYQGRRSQRAVRLGWLGNGSTACLQGRWVGKGTIWRYWRKTRLTNTPKGKNMIIKYNIQVDKAHWSGQQKERRNYEQYACEIKPKLAGEACFCC